MCIFKGQFSKRPLLNRFLVSRKGPRRFSPTSGQQFCYVVGLMGPTWMEGLLMNDGHTKNQPHCIIQALNLRVISLMVF